MLLDTEGACLAFGRGDFSKAMPEQTIPLLPSWAWSKPAVRFIAVDPSLDASHEQLWLQRRRGSRDAAKAGSLQDTACILEGWALSGRLCAAWPAEGLSARGGRVRCRASG